MSLISLVAAVDEQGGLGYNNKLLCHLPADLQYFKSITLGKPIIMGRKTFAAIGRVLPGRLNIILSKSLAMVEGAVVVTSFEEALQISSAEPEIMVIGGAEIFAQALPQAQRIYLTMIHHQFQADVFFPVLDESWICKTSRSQSQDEKNQFDLTFCVYERK